MKKLNLSKTIQHIVNWIKTYADNANIDTLVVGVSGGIDSSVVSTLCAMVGKNVILIEMPIGGNYNTEGVGAKHILSLQSKYNNVTHRVIDLTDTFNAFKTTLSNTTNHAESDNYKLMLANSASRCRMMTLYSFSNIHKGLVVGTGNKVEDFGIGFFSTGGDGVVDISPIADLMKSEVYGLAEELELIPEVVSAIPTDGLWEDERSDESQIGASYDELEWAMGFVYENTRHEQGIDPYLEYNIEDISERENEVLSIYLKRHKANKYKMLPIPICRLDDSFYI